MPCPADLWMLKAYRHLRSGWTNPWAKTPSGPLKTKVSASGNPWATDKWKLGKELGMYHYTCILFLYFSPELLFVTVGDRTQSWWLSGLIEDNYSSVTLKTCGTRENLKVLCLAEARHLFLHSFILTEPKSSSLNGTKTFQGSRLGGWSLGGKMCKEFGFPLKSC